MVRRREVMMVVMRLRVEWISLVWNWKDILSLEKVGGGGEEEGSGDGG